MDHESGTDHRPQALLTSICEPILAANGFELVEAIWQMNRRQPSVRLLVHRPGGITIGECQRVLRMLEPTLRVEGILDDRTEFEVASPGLDRPLHTASDFRRAEGYWVAIRRRGSTDPAREERLVGRLMSVNGDDIHLALDSGEDVTVAIAEVIEGKFDIRF